MPSPANASAASRPADQRAASTIRVDNETDRIRPTPSKEFVSTPLVEDIAERAATYLEVGLPVHFAGPPGTGKTTLAFHLAAMRGRPVMLIHGDESLTSSDLVGSDAGYRRSRLVDNYVHSVLKVEEETRNLWVDHRLTTACEKGFTLIYDEFNRSSPETNNVLLSVLAEGILNLPKTRFAGKGYVKVSPDFRVVLTSNPEEYVGVHKTQDALDDRLVTIQLHHYDRDTEIEITVSRSGVSPEDARRIVDIVRKLRSVGVSNHRPTVRACIAIGKVLAHRGAHARLEDPVFRWVCEDVLSTDTLKVTRDGGSLIREKVNEAVGEICGDPAEGSY